MVDHEVALGQIGAACDSSRRMEILRQSVPMSEVVASWVRGEMASDRFGHLYRAAAAVHGSSPEALLAAVRGWPDAGYFTDFPQDVAWSLVRLDHTELSAVLYIDWDYWNDVSGGTRRPLDAAARMGWSEAIVPTPDIEPLVLVSDGQASRLVVLEGHSRLTGYVLAGDRLEKGVECFLGRSERISEWGSY